MAMPEALARVLNGRKNLYDLWELHRLARRAAHCKIELLYGRWKSDRYCPDEIFVMSNIQQRYSNWIAIDTQEQLDVLDRSVCWEDSHTVAFLGSTASEEVGIFPEDVSRSGYENWDIRILFHVDIREGSHLEIACADCDAFSAALFRNFTLKGQVDSLKRIEVSDRNGQRLFRCARLVHRFLSIDQDARNYYGFGPRDTKNVT
jgi:hypothetical protein